MPGSFVAGHYSTSGIPGNYSTNGDSADRVADEERGGVSRSGEGSCGPVGGLDTCPAPSSRGTTRPAETHRPADRVADEERGGVSRSRNGSQGLGRGLDTCPARSLPGTTRPAGPSSLPSGPTSVSTARGGASPGCMPPRRLSEPTTAKRADWDCLRVETVGVVWSEPTAGACDCLTVRQSEGHHV